MAWPNIDERRDKVKYMMDAGHSDDEIKAVCSIEFQCSKSAIYSDLRGFRGISCHRVHLELVALRNRYLCQYCGRLTHNGVVEHVISRSMGGHDEPYNITYACFSCNTLKKLTVWVPANLDKITEKNLEWRNKILSLATEDKRKCTVAVAKERINRYNESKKV